jgi:MFS family permease
MLSLIIWIAAVVLAYFAHTKGTFYLVATLAGIGMGSAQSVTRSLVALFTPQEKAAEFYGFLGVAGKAMAFVGPLVFGTISGMTGSQRPAILAIGIFFVVGMILLAFVNERRGKEAAAMPSDVEAHQVAAPRPPESHPRLSRNQAEPRPEGSEGGMGRYSDPVAKHGQPLVLYRPVPPSALKLDAPVRLRRGAGALARRGPPSREVGERLGHAGGVCMLWNARVGVNRPQLQRHGPPPLCLAPSVSVPSAFVTSAFVPSASVPSALCF